MAMRIVCECCGFINDDDASDCENCGRDIASDGSTDIPREYLKFKFYNKIDDTYSDCSSLSITPEEKTSLHDKEPDSAEMIKMCPDCKTCCDIESVECSECGRPLRRVTAVLAPKKQSELVLQDECSDDAVVFDLDIEDDHTDEKQLYLLIGEERDNEVPLVFENNMFIIGRNYQKCLNNCNYISRVHCFLKLTEDGTIYLGENKMHPSTNGTFIRTIGKRRERLIPGKGYKVDVGSVFYIDNIPILLHSK